MPPATITKRSGLSAAAAALTTACSPLSMFATLSPKDPAALGVGGQAYGPDPRQRLDVYVPRRRAEGSPIAVFFYGGSWDSGRRQDYNWVGRALASRGFVTVIADYRLYPSVRFPTFLEDGAQAIRWVVDHAGAYGGEAMVEFGCGEGDGVGLPLGIGVTTGMGNALAPVKNDNTPAGSLVFGGDSK